MTQYWVPGCDDDDRDEDDWDEDDIFNLGGARNVADDDGGGGRWQESR